MKLKITSNQKQLQKQTLSYRQRLEIELLESSNQDLMRKIQEELESNPFLEQDMAFETGHIRKEKPNFELLLNYVVKEKTLSEVLHDQIRLINKPFHRDLAFFISDMLDSNGYLNYSNTELLKYFPQYSEKDLETTLQIIQTLEPLGVGAHNLSECLLIQLKDQTDTSGNLAKEIIKNHLHDLANHRLDQISKATNANLKQIQAAIDLIQSLNPKPGSSYSNTASYLYPDIYCYVEDNEIYIEMMNETYGLHIVSLNTESKDKNIRQWKNNANALLRAIEKRNHTMYKVISSICDYQKNYFLYSSTLKPCTLKTIAEKANVHESTVSRCISNKSMIFNGEVIPLKYFFPKAIANDSVLEIQEMIRVTLKNEDPSHPFSDQEISNILKESEYEVSRRTVAKYREQLHIPSSSHRKRKG